MPVGGPSLPTRQLQVEPNRLNLNQGFRAQAGHLKRQFQRNLVFDPFRRLFPFVRELQSTIKREFYRERMLFRRQGVVVPENCFIRCENEDQNNEYDRSKYDETREERLAMDVLHQNYANATHDVKDSLDPIRVVRHPRSEEHTSELQSHLNL